jgi:hypothetical protein
MTIKSGYGLRDKKSGKLVGFRVESNEGGEFCNPESCTLEFNEDNIWIAKTKLEASYARLISTEWFNSDYESPINEIDPETLEVVKIVIASKVVEPDHIPTFEEYMQLRYNTKGGKYYDPKHYEYHIGEYRKGKKYGSISLYKIHELMEEQK